MLAKALPKMPRRRICGVAVYGAAFLLALADATTKAAAKCSHGAAEGSLCEAQDEDGSGLLDSNPRRVLSVGEFHVVPDFISSHELKLFRASLDEVDAEEERKRTPFKAFNGANCRSCGPRTCPGTSW
eukprot:gnl/TRDRNA2_/TRDRNA2_144920_c0_seq2.p1 gnl/TRDRNA2_/TRDRNA2_144920_c0~~gnl/TRDRNA2_/TRDRNA2_144920_c0_seq2.p1  ORF type:complete len:128 (-),score=21.02 gnl/TRDRNA2_/TRDRNA2_144920_c0_seq2:449-832(-)